MENSEPTLTVAGLLRSGWEEAASSGAFKSYPQLWSSFSRSSRAVADSDVEANAALAFLAKICSLRLSEDGSANPYNVMIATPEGRTMGLEDFRQEEVDFLREVVTCVDDYRVRARAADLLWLLGERAERPEYAAIAIAAYRSWPLDSSQWDAETGAAWSRAIDLCKRLGRAAREQLDGIEQQLTSRFLELDEGTAILQFGDILLSHRLARESAGQIARKLEESAIALAGEERLKRRYLDLAHSWYLRAQDSMAASFTVRQQVESWIREAESRRTGKDSSNLVAASLYESALQTYRQLSRSNRQAFGLETLGDELADLARTCGLLGLEEMESITSESIDLTDAARYAVDRVSGKDPGLAMSEFASLAGLRSFRDDKESAEKLIRDSPLGGLFPNIHYSRDGRVVHRTDHRPAIYGLESRLWDQMVQTFEVHVRLLVGGMLGPAFNQLSNEHTLTLRDFQSIAFGSSLVPRDRITTVARGLLHGYNGDFTSAMYVLTPQVENMVRQALREARISTSTIDASGIETEIGLSALMQMDESVAVLGEDLAYELRALYCGPVGPNIRNVAAHGLLEDASHQTAHVFYVWWFVLRLVYASYWNQLRGNGAKSTKED
jgi:tetratricopeptide (TPR) repeat protein